MLSFATSVVRIFLRPITRRIEWLFAAAIVFLLFNGQLGLPGLDIGSAIGGLRQQLTNQQGDHTRVIKVIDGDTIKVRGSDGNKVTVRMALLDAPEKSSLRFGHPECGGGRATEALKAAVAGKKVRLTRPSSEDEDKYGRLVREVWQNGHSIDQQMVRRGWAKQYAVANARVNRRVALAALRARREGRGVWRLCGGFGS